MFDFGCHGRRFCALWDSVHVRALFKHGLSLLELVVSFSFSPIIIALKAAFAGNFNGGE
jgi:hypothetical protein